MKQIRTLIASKRYSEALRAIEEERSSTTQPYLLVWKAICIQLEDSEETQYDLSDVEAALQKALEIDEEYVEALLELGWFYYNVLDDARRAQPFFERLLKKCRDLTTEGLIGAARCIAERDSADDAIKFLDDTSQSLIDLEKLDEARRDLPSRSRDRNE